MILRALDDVAALGLKNRPRPGSKTLLRMADFALWAAACETALWPAGAVARAFAANRHAAIECVIEADPVTACVREIMTSHEQGSGTASDFLRTADLLQREEASIRRPDWPPPPALAGGRSAPPRPNLAAGSGDRHCVPSRRVASEVEGSRCGRERPHCQHSRQRSAKHLGQKNGLSRLGSRGHFIGHD